MTRKATSRGVRTEHTAKARHRAKRPHRGGGIRGVWIAVGLTALILGLGVVLYQNLAGTRGLAAGTLPADVSGVLTYHRSANVYALSLDNKAERKLTNYPPGPAVEYAARSSDGSRLAIVGPSSAGSTLTLMDAQHPDSRVLLQESARYTSLKRPQWSPDARNILYTVHQYLTDGTSLTGEKFQAEQIDVDGSNRRVIASDALDAVLAVDGTTTFVRRSSTSDELVVLRPDGTERVLVPPGSFVSLAAPRFSPDGQWIAFAAVSAGLQRGERLRGPTFRFGPAVAYAHGLPWDIWLVDLSGNIRLVNKLAEDDPTLAWSPDGRYLAVSGETGVYVIQVSNGQVNRLANVGGFGGIDWTR
jgi:Tol biopolymer transport system component